MAVSSLFLASTGLAEAPTPFLASLQCPSGTAHFSSAGCYADGFQLFNCEGGNNYQCFKANVADIESISFSGDCGTSVSGWCTAIPTVTGSDPVEFDVTIPNGYQCTYAVLVPTLNPSQAFPVACTGSGQCPSGTFTVTGWTAIPTLVACYTEPGGGN